MLGSPSISSVTEPLPEDIERDMKKMDLEQKSSTKMDIQVDSTSEKISTPKPEEDCANASEVLVVNMQNPIPFTEWSTKSNMIVTNISSTSNEDSSETISKSGSGMYRSQGNSSQRLSLDSNSNHNNNNFPSESPTTSTHPLTTHTTTHTSPPTVAVAKAKRSSCHSTESEDEFADKFPPLAFKGSSSSSQSESHHYSQNHHNMTTTTTNTMARKLERQTSAPMSNSPISPLLFDQQSSRRRISFSDLGLNDIQPEEDSAALIAIRFAADAKKLPRKMTIPARQMSMANSSSSAPIAGMVVKRSPDGREIQQDHAQYALTYGMMLGIRVTVGHAGLTGQNHPNHLTRELTPEDFTAVTRLRFHPEGSNVDGFHTPPHKLKHTFKFKDYAPAAFRRIRRLSGIDEVDYVLSLAGDFNYIEFLANSKSGQYFFYSHCGKYMIKTQSKGECRKLLLMLPHYLEHLSFVEPKGKIYFIIMSSVFNTDLALHVRYDLKGSTVGRYTPENECAAGSVQKDQNLMKSERVFHFGEHYEAFRKTLSEDSQFLASRNVMDYSLLVGIHDGKSSTQGSRHQGVQLSEQPGTYSRYSSIATDATDGSGCGSGGGGGSVSKNIWRRCHNGFPSAKSDGKEVYFFGIIDILQAYNTKKKISAVDPDFYARRFTEFIMRHSDASIWTPTQLPLPQPPTPPLPQPQPLPPKTSSSVTSSTTSSSSTSFPLPLSVQTDTAAIKEIKIGEQDNTIPVDNTIVEDDEIAKSKINVFSTDLDTDAEKGKEKESVGE
eukprot:gene656-1267_t